MSEETRKRTGYIGIDCEPEWTHHPDILEYQILLNRWERAYDNFKKHPTPEHREEFMKVDSWVKTITLHIRDINSQLD